MIIHVQSKCNTIHKYAQETPLIKCVYIYAVYGHPGDKPNGRRTRQVKWEKDPLAGSGVGSGTRSPKCTGAGREREPDWRERDGRGRVACGSGRERYGIPCPVQHSNMYVNLLSTYCHKKYCHTSTTLQSSIVQFVQKLWGRANVKYYISIINWFLSTRDIPKRWYLKVLHTRVSYVENGASIRSPKVKRSPNMTISENQVN